MTGIPKSRHVVDLLSKNELSESCYRVGRYTGYADEIANRAETGALLGRAHFWVDGNTIVDVEAGDCPAAAVPLTC